MWSVIEPVQIGRVLPAIFKLPVFVDPKLLEIALVSCANRLELVHGAPGRNGP